MAKPNYIPLSEAQLAVSVTGESTGNALAEAKPNEPIDLLQIIDGELLELAAVYEHLGPSNDAAAEIRAAYNNLSNTRVQIGQCMAANKPVPPTLRTQAQTQIRIAAALLNDEEGDDSVSHRIRVQTILAAEEREHHLRQGLKKAGSALPTVLKPPRKHVDLEIHPDDIVVLGRRLKKADRQQVIEEREAQVEREKPERRADKKQHHQNHTEFFTGVAAALSPLGRKKVYAAVLDDHGAATAAELDNQRANAKTVKEREYWDNQYDNAVDRRVWGTTFIEQEVTRALPQGAGYTTDQVMEALIRNGAFENGGHGFFHWHETNAEWSDGNLKRIDENADGQLSRQEIIHALRDATKTMAVATRAAKEKNADEAVAKTTLGQQLQRAGAAELQKYQWLDRDHDGKVELYEAYKGLRDQGIKEIVDANGNHKLDMEDVRAALHATLPKAAKPANHQVAKLPAGHK